MYDNRPTFFRYLRARNWEADKALVMFRNHLEWREQWELGESQYVQTEIGPLPKLLHNFRYPELTKLKQTYPFSHHKTTKSGAPLYFDRVGSIDPKLWKTLGGAAAMMRYFVWRALALAQSPTQTQSLSLTLAL